MSLDLAHGLPGFNLWNHIWFPPSTTRTVIHESRTKSNPSMTRCDPKTKEGKKIFWKELEIRQGLWRLSCMWLTPVPSLGLHMAFQPTLGVISEYRARIIPEYCWVWFKKEKQKEVKKHSIPYGKNNSLLTLLKNKPINLAKTNFLLIKVMRQVSLESLYSSSRISTVPSTPSLPSTPRSLITEYIILYLDGPAKHAQ